MQASVTVPALRIKVTGVCNRSCHFCHEEGDMRGIDSVRADAEFFSCVHALCTETGITRVMFTGGEPTVHANIVEIVSGIDVAEKSMTTNGILPMPVQWWEGMKHAGLTKAIFSVHDATVQSFLGLESRPRSVGWALRALNAQRMNMLRASQAGIAVRANVVVHGGVDSALRVVRGLRDLEAPVEIRLLNDLANIERSQRDIEEICRTLDAIHLGTRRRAGTSNVARVMRCSDGHAFSIKLSYPYFFDPVCANCTVKGECLEGFYGLRLEAREGTYFIRLCIYKQSAEVLMPWRDFLATPLVGQMRDRFVAELSERP